MNLKIIDEDNFVLFLINKEIIFNLNEDEISEYLKKVFIKIKEKYKIDIYGYYEVTIYTNQYYGMIIKIVREKFDYVSFYDKQIEMKITISDSPIFYKVKDIYNIDKKVLSVSNIYIYNDIFYLELKSDLNFILLGILYENSDLVFENTEEIKKYGEKIEIR